MNIVEKDNNKTHGLVSLKDRAVTPATIETSNPFIFPDLFDILSMMLSIICKYAILFSSNST